MAQRRMSRGITVVVLAGGPHDELAAHTPGAPNKAFVEIAGVTLVERTLRALRAAPSVGRIIAVAPPQTHGSAALALADERRPDGERIRDSLRSGLRDLPPDDDVLVSTSDLPVLTVESIEDYVLQARGKDGDLTYGCLEKRVHMAKYPQVPHTWAPLRDGTYCGTGFITIRPRVFPSLERFIEQLGQARKNPLHLARLFGMNVLLRFALRRLSIAQAEARASQVIGAPVRAVISPFAEIGVNVDRVSDIALARQLVAAQAELRL
ncbi:MAG TPA: NTP transferase domain-containing protein [Candidatus Baltobacteraceae bacterium]|nr:NTP transferase domain-containing protein [Candidatus Baltobacteraceae bacterium]